MTPDEFAEAVRSGDEDEIAKDTVLGGDEHHFPPGDSSLTRVRNHLTARLPIKPEEIRLVGSAKFGFSLSPDTFGRKFSRYSDLDFVVVNPDLFDRFWSGLIRWNYPRRYRLTGLDARWAIDRANDVYWGYLSPSKLDIPFRPVPESLIAVRDLINAWFEAFQSLSRLPEISSREVNSRLYRTMDHAVCYHADGLRKVVQALDRRTEQ